MNSISGLRKCFKGDSGKVSKKLTFPLSHFLTCKGITLLELLVALTITVLLGTALFTIFRTSMDAWQRGEATTQRCQPARDALELMSKDIRSAILLSTDNNPDKDVRFYGTTNTLYFISLANTTFDTTNKCDFCKIGYEIYSPALPAQKYLRRGKLAENIPGELDIDVGHTWAALAYNVEELNFSYWDGDSWETTWDSSSSPTEDELPSKVWIGFTVQADVGPAGTKEEDYKEEVISTIVYLPLS